MAAWLWLPRLRGREAAGAAAALAVAALFGLAFMKPVASDQPWVDYRHWSWTLPKEKTVAFDWSHKYGPLEWPRKGTTLLLVKAKQAHYWKAENLDRFDGRRWTNAGTRDSFPGDEDVLGRKAWNETIEFTVRGLASQVIVGAGTVIDVTEDDIGETIPLSDATYVTSGGLEPGDTYRAHVYVPDPSARAMRAAAAPPLRMQRYTELYIPNMPVTSAPLRASSPLVGERAEYERLVRKSPYSRVYKLAQRIAAGATTDYDVVKRIDAYLEKNYAYSEDVPSHLYPLNSFLFQDKRGYCQQFSGAAALMLRMLGIPTRVASGFTPGTLNKETHEYVVQDLDAHSWIEVWFSGIGWVPFDPTPALAPAQSQSAAAAAASAARGDARDRLPRQSLDRLLGTRPDASLTRPDENSGKSLPWGPILLGLAGGLLGLSALIVWWRARRRARPACLPPCGDPEVDGLIRLMTRLGLEVRPGTTLFELEARLATVGGPDAAGYARRLRERRFGLGSGSAPGRDERRRARRALAAGTHATRLARIRLALPDNPLKRR
jgi:transglutaminase-like putative cysteine protease